LDAIWTPGRSLVEVGLHGSPLMYAQNVRTL
jgi:hypothetical protein